MFFDFPRAACRSFLIFAEIICHASASVLPSQKLAIRSGWIHLALHATVAYNLNRRIKGRSLPRSDMEMAEACGTGGSWTEAVFAAIAQAALDETPRPPAQASYSIPNHCRCGRQRRVLIGR